MEIQTPLVSVIIPNYNHSLYLKERIDSVLNQDYSNLEVILLDDCSSDNSVDIIESYRDNPKVSQICINTQNSGSTFKQWEKGINLTRGEYIWIAESDDSADLHLLSTLMNALIENSSSVLGFCNSVYIDANGKVIQQSVDVDDVFDALYTVHDGVDFIRTKMLYNNRIYNASAVVFKRNAWKKVDKQYMNYQLCGDWYFWLSVLIQGDVLWLHKAYNKFRKHEQKVTPKALKNGVNYEELHFIVKYLNSVIRLNFYRKYLILGVIYVSLIKNRKILPSIRRKELKKWLLEYPEIPICSLVRVVQYYLVKFGVLKKYKQPKVLNIRY